MAEQQGVGRLAAAENPGLMGHRAVAVGTNSKLRLAGSLHRAAGKAAADDDHHALDSDSKEAAENPSIGKPVASTDRSRLFKRSYFYPSFQNSYSPHKPLSDKECAQLCELCTGKPVFVPDPGCEYLWSKGWGRHVALTLLMNPDIARSIIESKLELKGQPLKSIGLLELEHASKEDVRLPHVFEEPECWRRYDCCWFDKSDFGDRLPHWAKVTCDDFNALKAQYEFPERLCDMGRKDSAWYKKHGFYNVKHLYIFNCLGCPTY